MNKPAVLYIFLFFFFSSCSSTPNPDLPFDFNHPDDVIKLPQKLHEISGISFYRKNELACVQDEKGIIFFYNIKKDKLRNSIPFGADKDYEGVTDVNDTLYVLCSNGVIWEVDNTDDSDKAVSYNTFLSKNNNSEGLCYDSLNNRLLVACKGKPKKKTAGKGMKAVYGFDLATKKMSEDAVYIIDPDSVEMHLVSADEKNFMGKLFESSSDEKNFNFDPSEIAIDPLSGNIYLLSSVGKTLLVMTASGEIRFAVHLDPHMYKQPEGLAFSSDGSLYISDEGKDGKANVIKLKRSAIIEKH